ncbi:hypothetical protein, partial [Ectopseudomonas mendocina]|uniref:hypothetical protein n=1 Tax=Ectopseudomonas mendocina TaxID=300 RepID=UPI00376F2E7B
LGGIPFQPRYTAKLATEAPPTQERPSETQLISLCGRGFSWDAIAAISPLKRLPQHANKPKRPGNCPDVLFAAANFRP